MDVRAYFPRPCVKPPTADHRQTPSIVFIVTTLLPLIPSFPPFSTPVQSDSPNCQTDNKKEGTKSNLTHDHPAHLLSALR